MNNTKTKWTRGYKIAFGVLGGLLLLLAIIISTAPETKRSTWEKWQDQHVSIVDGSCKPLEKELKSRMNNPESYEHVETTYFLNNDTTAITAITKIRGTNEYGAVFMSQFEAQLDGAGNVLNVISE